MRPSNLQSRLIDTYGDLCESNGLNRLPFAEARQLSIDTLRHLISWQQHVTKHRDNPAPPAFDETPPGGWAAFDKRGPKPPAATKLIVPEPESWRDERYAKHGSGLAERQQHGARRVAVESFVEDYLNQ